MPASRPSVPLAEEIDSHDALVARDATNARRRRWVRWLAVFGILALVAGVVLGARPALHMVKEWQARRLARSAMQLMEEGNLEAAHAKVRDALTIWQREPDAIHAAALLLTRGGAYRQALPYWQELESIRPLTANDTRDYATTVINLGDADAAEALLRRVWPPGEPGSRPDWTLGMQIALRRGRNADAATLAKRMLEDAATPRREQLNAATVLLSSGGSSPGDRASAWKTVAAISRDGATSESLAALILVAQQKAGASTNQPSDDATPPLPDLIAAIDAHPLARTQQHLLAADLRISQDPSRRAELIQAAVDRYGNTKDEAELAALASWLYGKAEYEKILVLLPLTRTVSDKALYLQYLDTLAALGRWTEIRELVVARKFPLDAMSSQMFLARCASQLGESDVQDARWQAAVDAAGTDPAKLLAVGEYAAKNGAATFAEAAIRAAIRTAPDGRAAHEALVRLLESTGNTSELRAAVAAMAVHWPQDLAIRNDIAYLDALANENVAAARQTARDLMRADPASIPHRVTLALAELRRHDALAALDAFSGMDLARSVALQPRQGAVYAAVLWEASYSGEARAVLKNLALNRLLPEERELVRPIENDTATH